MIRRRRAYEPPEPGDGLRVLVDRVWPRGLSRDELHIARWERDLAPSTELRRWFGHDPARWPEFRTRYRQELASGEARDALARLADEARRGTVTLVYGARDTEHNQAAVLEEAVADQVAGDASAPG
ncbi:MAG TPA: DUF488 family protein [Thermomicrobiaceae bacterium]|nr:DUF488 family protein [Thermomicrobiaceae bacterium]